MNFSDEVVQDYAIEATERLDVICSQMVLLENNNPEIMNEILRSYHSIKGGAGFLNLEPIATVCHQLEAVFDALRTHKISMSQALIDAVLSANSELSNMLATLRQSKMPASCPVLLLSQLNKLVTPQNKTHAIYSDSVDWSQFQYDELIEAIQNKKDTHDKVSLLQSGATKKNKILSKVFKKFPPLVSDLAKKLGKEVDFLIADEKILVEQYIVDALFDPLVHLIRNALDHGIEAPTARALAKKPTRGCIQISAKKDKDWLKLIVSDDGSGIDAALVLKKAIALDLIAASEAKTLTENQVFDLILKPGFSTREEVTDLSGRGFGMDAVKNQIDALQGKIKITSTRQTGTQFELQIPLQPQTLSKRNSIYLNKGARK